MKLDARRALRHPSRKSSLTALLTLCLTFVLGSCGEQEVKKETRPSVTLENTQTAYARAVKHNRMYKLFVDRANKDHNKNLANLFHAIALSESIRAANHGKLLRSHGAEPSIPPEEAVTVGTALQTLKMALSSEDIQYERMYPDLIRTAAMEKDTAAVDQFTMAKSVDERHRELLNDAINKTTKIPKTEYWICPGCGYVLTSAQTDECPICHVVKSAFQKV
jgi:rubrerythrin